MGRLPTSPEACAAILLLLLQGALSCHALLQHNPTIDEPGFLLSGLLAWQRGDLTFYNVNPPLVKMMQALPLLTVSWELPSHSRSLLPSFDSWVLTWTEFLAVNYERLYFFVFAARAVNVLLSLGCGWMIYRWSRDLFGKAASLMALSLWVFCPAILAWTGVCTVDLGAAFCGLAAMASLRSYLRQPIIVRAVWAGSLLGLAQLAKFSLLTLYPVTTIIWFGAWVSARRINKPTTRPRWHHLAILLFTSLLVINLGYEFRGAGRTLDSYLFKCHALSGTEGGWSNRLYGTWLAKLPVPLPESYVTGLDEQKSHEDHGFPAYLRGQWQHGGWWYYYLYALAVKLPIGTLALIALGIFLFFCRKLHYCSLIDELLVWLPALSILLLISSQTGINAHLRYLLPMFPFLFIGISRLGVLLEELGAGLNRQRWGVMTASAVLVAASLVWNVAASVRTHPHYISYFNELAGGPDGGWHHLLESNIDWGQDLMLLKRWIERHPEAHPMRLAFYGSIDPNLMGIHYQLAPGATALYDLEPGWYAISVNLVGGAGFHAYDKRGKSIDFPSFSYVYFQNFVPVDKVGYSIFIYYLTSEEINEVRTCFNHL